MNAIILTTVDRMIHQLCPGEYVDEGTPPPYSETNKGIGLPSLLGFSTIVALSCRSSSASRLLPE